MTDEAADRRVEQIWDEILEVLRGHGSNVQLSIGSSLMMAALLAHVDRVDEDPELFRIAKLHCSLVGSTLAKAGAASTKSEFTEAIHAGIALQRSVADTDGKVS